MKHVYRPEEPYRWMTDQDIRSWAKDIADVERSIARLSLRKTIAKVCHDLGVPTRREQECEQFHCNIKELNHILYKLTQQEI